MDRKEVKKIVEVAKLYYENNLTQEEISSKFNISRPQISKILKKAKEMGLIKITVIDPFNDTKELQLELCKKFGLKEIRIATVKGNETVKQALGRESAEFLAEIIEDNDILGVSWGTTLFETANNIISKNVEGVKVVQFKGSLTHTNYDLQAFEMARNIAKAFKASVYYMPVPVLLESKKIKDTVMSDRVIKDIIELAQNCTIAMFSVGTVNENSTIAKSKYIETSYLETMRKNGAVGDIASRFFTIDGQIYDEELNSKTTSLDLDYLIGKKYSIGVAGGAEKATAILGAINGGYINVLITDEKGAEELLNIDESLVKKTGDK